MSDKIRILYYTMDEAGVAYFRIVSPATQLDKDHSDKFYVEINNQLDFNNPETIDYLKSFDIIHYHRQLHPDVNKMKILAKELKDANVKLVIDLDDFWELNIKHPMYHVVKEHKMDLQIKENIKIADYVTTTTDLFTEEIKKVTKKDNVGVFYNAINPEWMVQFQNNWKPDPDGKVRITYAGGSCYDDQTEILSENGWKLFKDLDKSEKVATLNSNNELEYQLPTDYTNEYYEGDMYYGKSKLIDFAVTPNHKMFTHKSKNLHRKKPFNFILEKMEDIKNYDLTFKKDCNWMGEEKEYYIIPEFNSSTKKFEEVKFLMDDWLKFFGYWVADGWATRDGLHQVGIAGSIERKKLIVEELKNILIKYGFNPTYTRDGKQLRVFNLQLHNHLYQFGQAFTKFIPKDLLNLSSRQLNILLKYFLSGDGHISKDGKINAYTSSPNLVNNISEIALKTNTCCYVKNRGKRTSKIKNREIKSQLDSYDLHLYRTDIKKTVLTPTVPNKNICLEKYSGNIYCVTVPNHIIYVKRNNYSYWCGNSHLSDIEQLEGVFNMLSANPETKDKFKIILAGWDSDGSTTQIDFNQEFGKELQERKMWTPEMVKNINKSRGNVDLIPNLPSDLKNKYRDNVFKVQQRPIKSEESVYFAYERILTDDHKIIENKDYLQWLMNFERNVNYFGDEGNFKRVWTQKANIYAKVLDETDIVIAPLADHKFNRMKSNLKQVECWSRKLPIVCTNIPPYNVHGKHMENCILIPPKKNQKQDWYKHLKNLILNPDLRKKLGEQLYEDFKVDYHLVNVTNKRAEFYKEILNKE